MKLSPAEVRSTSKSRKFLSKVTSGASSDPYVAVAIKHLPGAFVVVDRDEDDVVVVCAVEDEVVWSKKVVEDDVVEDVAEVDVEVAWVKTVKCPWPYPLLYPGLLAVAYTVYCPWGEFMRRLKVPTYAPDWSEDTD